MDELVARLRARAADPERRTDVRETQFFAGVKSLDRGGLLGMLGGLRPRLDRALDASRAGRVDPESVAMAEGIASAMSTPMESHLPPPAREETLTRAEAALGFALPPAIRRVYAEVADGRFGPGLGLLPIDEVVARYRELGSKGIMPEGRSWPEGFLPVVHQDPGWGCVEASTGRVIAWDPEELSERSSEARFQRSFRELSPSVEEWLGEWVTSKTLEERIAEQLAEGQVRAARELRAAIAKMTPEERAKMGLPEVGWERVVWGGLGLDEGGGTEEPTDV